jgi:non-ribosomal peptide synthetase-like protein
MLGLRIGCRLFDEGCGIPERTLVAIGDDCMLNAGSTISGHSLEDGTFKSGYIVIGAGCTVGINAFVLYGVRMDEGAALDTDSFLMKGEQVAPHARWLGNPAREVVDPAHTVEVLGIPPDCRPSMAGSISYTTPRAA